MKHSNASWGGTDNAIHCINPCEKCIGVVNKCIGVVNNTKIQLKNKTCYIPTVHFHYGILSTVGI